MAHGFLCTCKKCNPSILDTFLGGGGSKKAGNKGKSGNFSRKLPDGTKIYGPKSTEGRPGHKHGHSGKDFDRTPHSTIGSAAIGRPHTTKNHVTKRSK